MWLGVTNSRQQCNCDYGYLVVTVEIILGMGIILQLYNRDSENDTILSPEQ